MIRYIRLLGAALGGLVGLGIASANDGIFAGSGYAGALLAVWVVAWIVVGFGVLPYLTVVPATWLIQRVEELSTAEFVTAVIGFLLGLLMGLLLGFPLSNFPEPWGQILPLAVSLSLGLGMVGLLGEDRPGRSLRPVQQELRQGFSHWTGGMARILLTARGQINRRAARTPEARR